MTPLAWFIIGFYIPFILFGILKGLEWLNGKLDEITAAVTGEPVNTLKENDYEQI